MFNIKIDRDQNQLERVLGLGSGVCSSSRCNGPEEGLGLFYHLLLLV